MTDTQTSIRGLAEEYAGYFYRGERDDGSRYWATHEESPEELRELCREAHGDMFPDDIKYELIVSALRHIAEEDDCADWDAAEFADSAVPVYTNELTTWLASSLDRLAYCDEAADEFGTTGETMDDRIRIGYYMEASEVYGIIASRLEDLVNA